MNSQVHTGVSPIPLVIFVKLNAKNTGFVFPQQLTLNLILLCLVLGIGGTFQYGLHISLINSPAEHIQKFINNTWQHRYGSPLHPDKITLFWTFIVSVFSIGGLLGSLIVGYLSVRFGRKKTQLFNNVFALLGAALMMLSPAAKSFEMIIAGRFLYGVNAGVSLNLHTMYIGECAPKRLRGISVTVSLFIALGKLMGFVVGLRIPGFRDSVAYLMAFSAVPALIQLLTLPFFPESPRYLLIDKGNKKDCLKAMQQLWGTGDHVVEIDDMLAEKNTLEGKPMKSIRDLLMERCVHWQMISIVLTSGAIQLTGINAVYFYAYDVFRNAGIPTPQIPFVSLGIGVTEALTTVLCGFVIDRLGRKPLLWINYGVITVTLSFLTATLSLQDLYSWMPYFSSALIFIFTLSFGLGPGGVCCVIPTEMFVQSYRPAAYALIGILNWIGLFVLAVSFPFMEAALGAFCFVFFIIFCLCMAVFSFLILPETKNRSILEIVESFNQMNFKQQKRNAVCSTRL